MDPGEILLGENRVTRKVANNQLHANEKMLLQHAKTGVSIAADVHEIARFAQRTPEDVAILWDSHFQ